MPPRSEENATPGIWIIPAIPCYICSPSATKSEYSSGAVIGIFRYINILDNNSCKINACLPSVRTNFNYLHHYSVEFCLPLKKSTWLGLSIKSDSQTTYRRMSWCIVDITPWLMQCALDISRTVFFRKGELWVYFMNSAPDQSFNVAVIMLCRISFISNSDILLFHTTHLFSYRLYLFTDAFHTTFPT